jgi:rod shape-determining protein MreC
MSDEQVSPGEAVLTSGGDQIFPKGLPIGTVTSVGHGKDLFLNIKIKPGADLSQLEEVLVLVEKQERQASADDSVRLRASDILAQRLPSVPDKPTDARASAAAVPPGSTPATQPKSEIKPQGTGVAKPQGVAGSTKAAQSGAPGTAVPVISKTNRKPAGTSGSAITVLPDQPVQRAEPASTTGADPAMQTDPPSTQPAPAKPSTPPPTNPQPPADGNSPQ